MNIIELAKKAAGDTGPVLLPDPAFTGFLERFARLVIEAHVASVGVEPVAWTTKGQIAAMGSGFNHYIQARVPRFVQPTENDVPLYTAEQLAAVRHRALEDAELAYRQGQENGYARGTMKLREAEGYKEAYLKLLEQIASLKALDPSPHIVLQVNQDAICALKEVSK